MFPHDFLSRGEKTVLALIFYHNIIVGWHGGDLNKQGYMETY